MMSTPNQFDEEELKAFKRRARSRQESFNSRLKNFGALEQRFRHGQEKHKIVFEA